MYLSAAFDTVDHQILLDRLQTELFGVTGIPLIWLWSYLDSRTQFVKMGQHHSPVIGLEVGLPQGSVLGPLLQPSGQCHHRPRRAVSSVR